MKSLTFNGIRKDWLYLLQGREKPPFAPLDRRMISVPGMAGAYLSSTNVRPLPINQPIGIVAKSDVEALQIKEELAEWLYTDRPVELQFDDEPGRTYYAIVVNTIEDFSRFAEFRTGTIQFLCLDPYSYGSEQTIESNDDTFIIENKGTAEADPIFELTATQKSTFAMISNGEEYNLIGTPADDDVQVVDSRTSILYENGSTINTWQTATLDMLDDYHIKSIGGTMTSDGAGIRADGYGTGDGLHGPAVFKEITPIQDFELETTFDIISERDADNFRMGIMLHDENMNNLGHLGMKDDTRYFKRRTPLGRVGPWGGDDRSERNVIGDNDRVDGVTNTTLFYLRMKRIGNIFEFYIAEWRNQRHIRQWRRQYHDIENLFGGKLRYVTIYIANYADRLQPLRLRITSLEVFELSQATIDETPYILYPGDVVTFDHKNDDILVNGEPRMDLKNFGGSFFKLNKGFNTIIVSPENTFETKLRFKERYR